MKGLKKVLTSLTAIVTAATVSSALSVSAETMEGRGFSDKGIRLYDHELEKVEENSYWGVYNVQSKNIGYGMISIAHRDKKEFRICFETAKDKPLTAKQLGLSEGTKIITGNFSDKNVYTVYTDTDEELKELYQKAEELTKNGVIDNAESYTKISYCPSYYDEGTEFYASLDLWLPPVLLVSSVKPDDTLYGDANGDGSVNVRDCAVIAAEMAKIGKSDKTSLSHAADINADGRATITDAAVIAYRVANGLI